jgi:hypothetical protein
MKAAIAILATMLLMTSALAQPAQNGRYNVLFSPHVRADTFLLDTQTGQVWILSQYSDLNGKPSAWTPMTRLDNAQQEAAFAKAYGMAPPPDLAPIK